MAGHDFLHAILTNKQYFNATQKTTVRGIVSHQVDVLNTYNERVGTFALSVAMSIYKTSRSAIAFCQQIVIDIT